MTEVLALYPPPTHSDEAFRQLAVVRRRAAKQEELRRQQGLPSDAAWLAYLDEYEAYLHASIEATVKGLPQPAPPACPAPDGHVVADH